MVDSDDDLICISEGPAEKEWPTDEEIDAKTELFVNESIAMGMSPKDLALKDVMKVI